MKNSFPKKALKIPLDKRSKIIRKSIIKGIVEEEATLDQQCLL